MLQRFCGELEAVKSPQGVFARARRLRTALFMLLQSVQPGLVFLDDQGAGSHSVRDSTFRIVSSFTFFPRSSQLLDWERVVTLPGPVPPGKMPAVAHADPELLVELGLSRLAVFCAWGGPHQCPTRSEPDMGSLGQGSWRHILGEIRCYSGQLWSA